MATPLRVMHTDYTFATRHPRLVGKRVLDGYAYAANGNVHNPTPRYYWVLLRDGHQIVDHFKRKRDLVDAVAVYGTDYVCGGQLTGV